VTPASIDSQTILVVEDDPTISEILRILLEDSGCRILTAMDGAEAISLARRERPDLITLDMRLPDMDGVEVLGKLRADHTLAVIPVIVVSARDLKASDHPGVFAVLPKPFDAVELDHLVRRALLPPIRSFEDADR